MNRRIIALNCAGTLLAAIVLLSSSFALGAPSPQANPTGQQQTIDAVVNQFFTQTAEVDKLLSETQTIEAAFNQAQTGTAAFQTAIYDSFNQALTATAYSKIQATQTYQENVACPQSLYHSLSETPDGCGEWWDQYSLRSWRTIGE